MAAVDNELATLLDTLTKVDAVDIHHEEVLAAELVEESDDNVFERIRAEFALCGAAPLDAILAKIACYETDYTTTISPCRPTWYMDAVLHPTTEGTAHPFQRGLPLPPWKRTRHKYRPHRTCKRHQPRAPNGLGVISGGILGLGGISPVLVASVVWYLSSYCFLFLWRQFCGLLVLLQLIVRCSVQICIAA